MWLPEDERKLLTIYYLAISESLKKVDSTPTAEKWYSTSDLVRVFEAENYKEVARGLKDDYHKAVETTYGKNSDASNSQWDKEKAAKDIKQLLVGIARIDAAKAALIERNLIKVRRHGSVKHLFGVSLTIQGYDLGRQYNNRLDTIGLWCAAKEHKWLWYLITLVIGFLGGLLLRLLL